MIYVMFYLDADSILTCSILSSFDLLSSSSGDKPLLGSLVVIVIENFRRHHKKVNFNTSFRSSFSTFVRCDLAIRSLEG